MRICSPEGNHRRRRSVLIAMRSCLAFVVLSTAWGQTPAPLDAKAIDAKAIVAKSLAVDNRNEEVLGKYTYKMLHVDRDSPDKAKTSLFEVIYVAGERFQLQTERDGKPLPEAEAAKARAHFDKAVAAAEKLSPEERRKREAEQAKRRARNLDQRQYIPEAFTFQLEGEEDVNGRKSWRIRAEPTGTYKGPHAELLRNMRGTLWIDQQDYEWTKVEAESLGTISFGWFLARLGKGAAISFENQRINGELWAPKRVAVRASVRLALLAKAKADTEITFTDYKKFQTDSRLVSTEAIPDHP